MINFLFNLALYFCRKNEAIPRERKSIFQKIYYNGMKLFCNILIESCFFLKYKIFRCNFESLDDDDSKPIVSITTFPKRVGSLWIVLCCVYNQTFRPGKIVLVLTKEEFPEGLKSIPNSITKFLDKGLEIVFTDNNLRPHNKYYYTLNHYRNRIVITLDDDILYWKDTISRLMELHEKYPGYVCGNIVGKINLTENKFEEIHRYDGVIESNNMALGVYGILYPVEFRSEELFNEQLIRDLCLNADDIWLFFQERLSHVGVVGGKSYNIPLMILNSQNVRLMNDNVLNNGNRDYFSKMKKYYNLDLI